MNTRILPLVAESGNPVDEICKSAVFSMENKLYAFKSVSKSLEQVTVVPSVCCGLQLKSKCISEETCPSLETVCWTEGQNHWTKSVVFAIKRVRPENHKDLLQS